MLQRWVVLVYDFLRQTAHAGRTNSFRFTTTRCHYLETCAPRLIRAPPFNTQWRFINNILTLS